MVARRHEDGGFTSNDFAVFRSASEQSSFAIGNARIHRYRMTPAEITKGFMGNGTGTRAGMNTVSMSPW